MTPNQSLSQLPDKKAVTLESVLLHGDLSRLSSEQKVSHYLKICEIVGVDPHLKPFEYIKMNGKEVLYATKSCTEQLRNKNKVSLSIVSRETIEGVYVVTANAKMADREDASTGAVSIKGLSGEALANAFMKAETKAKRRVTLSICGLSLLDESEVHSVPGATKGGEVILPPVWPAVNSPREYQVVGTPATNEDIKKEVDKAVARVLSNNQKEEPNDFAPTPISDEVQSIIDSLGAAHDYTIPGGSLKGVKLSQKDDKFWDEYRIKLGKVLAKTTMPEESRNEAEDILLHINEWLRK